jgi:predicted nucleic acid-binding protein
LLNYPISVFLDTNIFIEAKYDFSSKGIFCTLNKYINDDKIRLFISNIVENEVKKHINEDAAKLCNIFKDARTNIF